MVPTNQELDAARLSLRRLPADTIPHAARRPYLQVIQSAADALAPEDYARYHQAWLTNLLEAEEMERSGILYHLRQCVDQAIAEFRTTRVVRGLVCWLVYNMGCLVRTPGSAFGIDLSICAAERLAGDLDFLLTTHEHADHHTPPLLDAMIQAGKPCITRWYPGSTLVTRPTHFHMGDVNVEVLIGDHHYRRPDQRDNMLMFHIRTDDGASLLHTGDNSNLQRLPAGLNPGLFMFHIAVGLPVPEAIGRVSPHLALPAHVLELEHSPHPPQAWRWSFDYAAKTVADFDSTRAPLLSWGERATTPGTQLEMEAPICV